MIKTIAKKVASAIIPTGLPLPIVSGPMQGQWWIVGAAAGANKGLSILFNGSEPEQVLVAEQTARSHAGGVCLDIGANVGFYTLLFSTLCKHVYAFEPFPRNLSFLERMRRLNKLSNVTVLPFAVSNESGFMSFEAGDNCALGKLSSAGTQPVAMISCDDFCERYEVVPAIIKIDVEGGEHALLQGARKTLTENKPDILLSIHSDALREDCLNLLKEYGYGRFQPLTHDTIEESTEFLASVCAIDP